MTNQEENGLGKNEPSGELLQRRYRSRFIIYSTAAILIIGAIFGWLLANSIRTELVEAYGHSTAAQVNAAVRSFLSLDDLKHPLKGDRYKRFSENLDAITAGTGVVEIKIWRPDGTIIFSKNRDQVGKKFPKSKSFRKAIKGQGTFEFSDLPEQHHEKEQKKYTHLVEVYHPLHLTKSNRVNGVFEVYFSPGLINKHIGHALRSLVIALGLLGLLIIIFAHISSRMLRNRNDHLSKLTDELEEKTTNLQGSEARFRAIADTANDAILSMNMNSQITSWNPSGEKIFGYSSGEVLGKNMTILMPERWRNAHEQAVAKIAAGNVSKMSGKTFELTALRKNGEEFPITLSLAESKTHRSHAFIGMIRDITERKKSETALQESEQRFRTLVENSSERISKLDLDGNFQFMNRTGLKLLSTKMTGEIIGKNFSELIEPQHQEAFFQELNKAKDGKTAKFQYQSQTPSGLRWFESVLSPQYDNVGEPESMFELASDITERKLREEKLNYLSTHDPLTNLYNHGAFFDFLEQEIERSNRHGHQFALLMLDLDHFKKVNDTFGHTVGDTVLSEVASRIKRACRTADITSRYGGEEFTVIMPQTSLESALQGAERILNEIAASETTRVGDQSINITISIGVAIFPENASTSQKLVELADANLFAAKKSGRNRISAGSKAA